MRIELLPPGGASPDVLDGLADLLLDSVADGASIGFMADLSQPAARDWWVSSLRDAGALTWAAREPGRIVGTVRLIPVRYPNGAHRADVSKFLVLRSARGRGIGSALMAALEAGARADGRSLLMLDTETGSPAEAIYRRWGWQSFGAVEGHAAAPDGQLKSTTFMTKRL